MAADAMAPVWSAMTMLIQLYICICVCVYIYIYINANVYYPHRFYGVVVPETPSSIAVPKIYHTNSSCLLCFVGACCVLLWYGICWFLPISFRVVSLALGQSYMIAPVPVKQPWRYGHIYHHNTLVLITMIPPRMVNSMWPSDIISHDRSLSTLVQVLACCLMAPSHYLNQCWLAISKILWQFYIKYSRYLSLIWVWNLLIYDYNEIFKGPMSQ